MINLLKGYYFDNKNIKYIVIEEMAYWLDFIVLFQIF